MASLASRMSLAAVLVAGPVLVRPSDAAVMDTNEDATLIAQADENAPETAPDSSSPSAAPAETPPPPPSARPPPPPAEGQAQAPRPPPGQWVYTQQYGWVWMPYGDAYTYAPPDGYGEPYMYVYYPVVGWAWVVAPWVWGWGPWPLFVHGPRHFAWYAHGWWRTPWRWHYAPAPFHAGVAGRFALRGGVIGQRPPGGHAFAARPAPTGRAAPGGRGGGRRR